MKKFLIVFILAFCVAIHGCKKDPVFYTITSSVSGGGTIDPLGISSVEAGSSIIYTIKPDANYSISSIKVDGIDFPVSSTIEIKNVSSNTEIKVEFTLNTFTITASADFGVVLDPKGVFTVASGDSMTFSFNAIPDRSIKSIQINGNAVNTYPNQNYVLDGNNVYIKVKEDASLKIRSISNDSLYIMSGGWYLQEDWSLDLRDSTWHEMVPSDKLFKLKWAFSDYNGGSATWYDENNKIFWGPYLWTLDKGELRLKNTDFNYTIVYLDDKKLVVDIMVSNYDLDRETYTHTPKKL